MNVVFRKKFRGSNKMNNFLLLAVRFDSVLLI